MTIQINTDSHIKGTENMVERFTEEIKNKLKRFDEYVTLIDVYLSDENRGKQGPDDKKCNIEARIKGMQPVAVSANADTLDKALAAAILKAKSVLDTKVAQLKSH